jgi:hypothetical protein
MFSLSSGTLVCSFSNGYLIYFKLPSLHVLEVIKAHNPNSLGGSSQPVRTTKLNITRMESRLPTTLSKTFQDAITITRALSIRYLWIDSLCIIQDDKQDWEKESGQMASIYEHAYLVISAAHASDGSKGCFSNHPAPEETLRPFHNHKTPDGSIIPFYLRYKTQISHEPFESHYPFYTYKAVLPLHYRAWALQERILATRIVHFTTEELVWECHTGLMCECMGMDYSISISYPNQKLLKQLWRELIRGDSHDPDPRYDHFGIWQLMLTTYSRLDITEPSDRLPALSGLAKKMQAAGAGNYLAGLWENNLLRDLLWSVNPYAGPTRRADPWQSPSWSWAGLQLGRRQYISHSDSSVAPGRETIRVNSDNLMLAADKKMATTVKEIDCKAASKNDKTGRISQGASLTISAPTISISAIIELKRYRYPVVELHKSGRALQFGADCMLDFLSNDNDKRTFKVVCAWIGTLCYNSIILPQILVLRASSGIGGVAATPGAYERVGVISSYVDYGDAETLVEWFREAELREVKIV